MNSDQVTAARLGSGLHWFDFYLSANKTQININTGLMKEVSVWFKVQLNIMFYRKPGTDESCNQNLDLLHIYFKNFFPGIKIILIIVTKYQFHERLMRGPGAGYQLV